MLTRSSLFLISIVAFASIYEGQAQTYDFLAARNLNQVQALAQDFGLPSALYQPITGVDAYRVTYTMPFLDDSVVVSGALFEPTDLDPACAHPVHIYMHGTIFARTDAPSFLSYEGQLGYLMAGLGFTVLMPDYVGLGTDDQHLHPYVHAQSEASSGAHLIQAIHTTPNPSGNIHDPNQLFISGYSQGGHAAMALHHELQANWPQYPVTASAPGSGPYSITGVQFPETFANDSYSNPSYLAYTALAWQSVYGNLYEDPAEYFQEPYASQLDELFDGVTTGPEINAALPFYTADFVQPGVLDLLLVEGEPFEVAATDNDVYDWIPQAPLRMYYCTEDEQVFYQNALFAEEHMNALGATTVEAINLGAYDHSGCAGQAIFGATLWFNSQAVVCGPASDLTETMPATALFFPNPAKNSDVLQIAGGVQPWEIWSMSGNRIRVGNSASIDLAGISGGVYTVRFPAERAAMKLVVLD
ncbi:MAG: lipase family protein [Flavobacteriales bacterium]